MTYPQTIRVLALKPATSREILVAATALKRPVEHICYSLASYIADKSYACCPEVAQLCDRLAAIPQTYGGGQKKALKEAGLVRQQVEHWTKTGAYPSPTAMVKIRAYLAK